MHKQHGGEPQRQYIFDSGVRFNAQANACVLALDLDHTVWIVPDVLTADFDPTPRVPEMFRRLFELVISKPHIHLCIATAGMWNREVIMSFMAKHYPGMQEQGFDIISHINRQQSSTKISVLKEVYGQDVGVILVDDRESELAPAKHIPKASAVQAHYCDDDFERELNDLLDTLNSLEQPSEDATQIIKASTEILTQRQEDVQFWQSDIESITDGYMHDILLRMLKRQQYHFLAAAKAALVEMAEKYAYEESVCEDVIAQSGQSLASQPLYYAGIDVSAMLKSYRQRECNYSPIMRSRHNMIMMTMVYHYPWVYFLDNIPQSHRLQSVTRAQVREAAAHHMLRRCKTISDAKTIALLSCGAQLSRLSSACLYMYTLLLGCVRSPEAKKVLLKQISEYLSDNAKIFLQFSNYRYGASESNFSRVCAQIMERSDRFKEQCDQENINQLSCYMMRTCHHFFHKIDYVPRMLSTKQQQKRTLVATDGGSQKRVRC